MAILIVLFIGLFTGFFLYKLVAYKSKIPQPLLEPILPQRIRIKKSHKCKQHYRKRKAKNRTRNRIARKSRKINHRLTKPY
jgi:hypothetical protein